MAVERVNVIVSVHGVCVQPPALSRGRSERFLFTCRSTSKRFGAGIYGRRERFSPQTRRKELVRDVRLNLCRSKAARVKAALSLLRPIRDRRQGLVKGTGGEIPAPQATRLMIELCRSRREAVGPRSVGRFAIFGL